MRYAAWLAGALLAAGTVALIVVGRYQPVEAPPAFGVAAAGVAAALAVATILVAVSRPWAGLLLCIAAMPVVSVARAQVSLGEVQLIPATLVIASLLAGTVLRGRRDMLPHAPPAAPAATWLLLVVGVVLAVAATLAAPADAGALNITLHGVLEPMAVFAVAIALRPSLGQVLQALVAVAASVALATIINLGWLTIVLVPFDLYEQRLLLARLTYFNAGIFGAMLVVGIPAAASLLFLRDRLPARRVAVIGASAAIGLMVTALFFTYTKSAWLSAALVASLLVVLLVPGWRRRLPMLLGVAVLLAVVVPYPLPILRAVAPAAATGYQDFLVALQGPGRLESWDPETYQGSGSIAIRLEAAGAAAELSATSPWLGVGPGHFQAEFARIRPDAGVPGLQSAHNLLPNLAAEYGLPFALLVGIGLLWVIGVSLRTGRSAAAVPRVLGTTIGVSLIGFVCMATLFGVDLYRPYRTMNMDVVTAAVLAALAISVARAATTREWGARPIGGGRVGGLPASR